MAPAETLKLAILRNPAGIAISDVSYLEPSGRRRPVFLGKIGDIIDLNRVDLPQFVRSLTQGVIRDMIRAGALVPAPQDLGEKRLDEVLAALKVAQAPRAQQLVNVGTPAHVEVLEPGVQVAVGDGTIQPQRGLGSTHLEPGVQVANNPQGSPEPQAPAPVAEPLQAGSLSVQAQQGVTLDSMESAQAEAAEAAKAEAPAETATSTPVVEWKANKNLKQQEEFLKASTDQEFLQTLIDDPAEESERLKNVAKKRLVELKKGA